MTTTVEGLFVLFVLLGISLLLAGRGLEQMFDWLLRRRG